jgi:serine/threonine-protein kinase
MEITEAVVGRVSPYHTASGIHCVHALIGHAAGDMTRRQMRIASFIRASAAKCANLDLTLGLSGTLLACAMLREASQSDLLLAPGNRTMKTIWKRAARANIRYLGIAHGWAGLLYATFRWCAASGAPLPAEVEPNLDRLARSGERRGRGMRWSIIEGEPSGGYMSGWCNGSAGYVHLWTEAYRATGKTAYLALAERAVWNAWEERLMVGQICCGLAGQAYGLLALYRHTNERPWLKRATELARMAAALESPPAPAHSLYKGDVGIAVLAADLESPDSACMPFFGSEGWGLR